MCIRDRSVGAGLVHRRGNVVLEVAGSELLDRGPHLATLAGLDLGLEPHQPRQPTGTGEHEATQVGLLGLLRRRSRVSRSDHLAGQRTDPGRWPVPVSYTHLTLPTILRV